MIILIFALLFSFDALAGFDRCKITSQTTLKDPNYLLPEVSGIAPSRANPGAYWVHNDSGNQAAIYGVRANGDIVHEIKLGEPNVDWEDITTGKCQLGGDCIFILDAGNNNHNRTVFQIYEVIEPKIECGFSKVKASANKYEFSYPDHGAYNSEALAYNQAEDRFYLTKKAGNSSILYAFPKPLTKQMVLKPVCEFDTKGGAVTAMDISADGTRILLKTDNREVFQYHDDEIGTDICRMQVSRETYAALGYNERQGEAVAYINNATGFISMSEGWTPSVYVFDCNP